MNEAAQKLLGVYNEVPHSDLNHPVNSQECGPIGKKDDVTDNTIRGGVSQQTDDAFWNTPDTLAALDEVMNAIEQRDRFKRMHNEGPSYSLGLGLTPDYVVAADDVDDGARQRTSVDRDKNIVGTSLTVDAQRVGVGLFDKTMILKVPGLETGKCATTGTARKKMDKVPDPNGDGGITDQPPGVQKDSMLDRTLDVPEHDGDRKKRSEVGAHKTSQPDSDDFVDDVPLSRLAEIKKTRHGTRRRAFLPLVQQGDTSTKPDKTEEAERVGGLPKRSKVGASTSQYDSDDFVDDVPIRYQAEITKSRNDKGKRKIDDTDIIVKHSVDEASIVDVESDDDKVFPSVSTRTSAGTFVKAISGLSNVKKNAVREMGFGRLLELSITTTPLKMGFWLVNNFNHLDRKLQLYDGEKVHVKKEDVYVVFGLPRGELEVNNKKKRVTSNMLDEWIALFDVRRPSNITMSKVLDKINECDDGSVWFKRHFIVLMLFYVDKVALSVRSVPRRFPTFSSWSNEALRNRERDEIASGAFGRGFVDADALDTHQHDKMCTNSDDVIAGVLENCSVQAYVHEFTSKTRLLATTGVEILQLVEKAPQVLLEDENFVKMNEAAQKLLGVYNELPHSDPNHPVNSQECGPIGKKDDVTYNTIRGGVSHQTNDAFWNAPDTLAALDEVMNAIEQRDRFKRMHNEGPSYSLGLGTPDYVVPADDVDDGARQRTSVDRDKNIAGMSLTMDAQRGTARKKMDKVPDPNGDGGITDQPPGVQKVSRRRTQLPLVQQRDMFTNPANIQEDPMLDRTLDVPEHDGDRKKRSEVGAHKTSLPDSDDFVDDVPLSRLAEIKKTCHGTRRHACLPLVQQGDTSKKPDKTEEERADGLPKRSKVGARTSQYDSDDFVDDVHIRYQAEITKSRNDKGKRKIDDTDIIVKHSINEASDVDVESDDDEVFPSVSTRTSAGTFVKAISDLSNVKKNVVREMGFGRLLELSITTTPLKMGFWLVNNFNHLDRKLQLYDGEKVHVKKEDVYVVFGLPRGELEVNNKKKRVTSNMLDEWIALFDVRRSSNITVSKVLDKINECNDGGVWFKRHFIVLMLFYVDKVVLSVRSVPRRFPTFSSWSNEALRNRECDEIASMPSGEVSWMQTLSIPTSMIKCVRTLTTS
ncbi:Unknown protein [Striga hermonthica]|uniref:Uncharacterized protein n=1 Tax=Striga hermonthica TaxID=68872 RepID=A0A9N7MBR3_STRHE|nr:Unknown protein [Striga hermonthica]